MLDGDNLELYVLGIGTIQDGKWEPLRAEWLEGTEISRWIALPQRIVLETPVEPLNSGDQISDHENPHEKEHPESR